MCNVCGCGHGEVRIEGEDKGHGHHHHHNPQERVDPGLRVGWALIGTKPGAGAW